MPSLSVREIDDTVYDRLKMRADRHGVSLEEEARQILGAALNDWEPASLTLAESIRRRFAGLGDVELPVAPWQFEQT